MVPSPLSTVADFAKETLKMSGQNGVYTISTGNFFTVASEEQNNHFNIPKSISVFRDLPWLWSPATEVKPGGYLLPAISE